MLIKRKETSMRKNGVLVIGCGRLGANIAMLRSLSGENVTVLDRDENSFRRLEESYGGYQIVGDGCDLKVLEEAGIKTVKEVVITTENDNTNLFISHVCYYQYKVQKIFVRLDDVKKSILLEDTNIKAIYPFLLSMNEFTKIESEED